MRLDLYLKIFQKLPSVSYNVYLIKHTECTIYFPTVLPWEAALLVSVSSKLQNCLSSKYS